MTKLSAVLLPGLSLEDELGPLSGAETEVDTAMGSWPESVNL